MVIYNIQTNGSSSELVIEVINDSVYVEPHAVAYRVGNLEIKAALRKFTDVLKSRFVGKQFYRPKISGTGKIYLKPTLGNYHKFSLKDQEKLIITNQAFIACRDTLHLDAEIDPSFAKFISGTPLVSSLISGHGNVVVQMPGEVIETKIDNDKFIAFSNDVAAYTPGINVTRELSSQHGGIGNSRHLVSVYRGSGSIFFTPHPNKGAKKL